MSSRDELHEDAAMYVLGLLPPDEARRLEAAMARDEELAALVGKLREGAGAIGASVAPRDPPANLRGQIMSRIEAQRPARQLPTLRSDLGWVVAACFALLSSWLAYERFHLHLMLDNFHMRDVAQQGELDRVQSHETENLAHLHDANERASAAVAERIKLQDALDSINTTAAAHAADEEARRLKLQAALDQANQTIAGLQARDAISQIKIATLASLSKNLPKAMAIVAWDGDSQRGMLKTVNFPNAAADHDYELWVIDPAYKQPISAGVIQPGAQSQFRPLQSISTAQKFAISLEKKGGAPAGSGPQGPVMLLSE